MWGGPKASVYEEYYLTTYFSPRLFTPVFLGVVSVTSLALIILCHLHTFCKGTAHLHAIVSGSIDWEVFILY